MMCPEGTPFQYRLENFEYRGWGKIIYSPWTEGTSVTMKLPKEKEFSINPAKLKWSDIDIAAQPTTQEKLDVQAKRAAEEGQAFEW